ncbi:MAG TPA: hypothetical protein VL068_00590, partial [Microthrixaceae bacterium]|nr:hypothetical protein [Microthrixaceae bacterium]
MAFGQASGPPANARQIEELASLLSDNGYDSFREARHPFGLNQRQSNGRFTIDEATELIERLEAMETVASGDGLPDLPSPHASGGAVPSSSAAKVKADRRRRERDSESVVSIDAE